MYVGCEFWTKDGYEYKGTILLDWLELRPLGVSPYLLRHNYRHFLVFDLLSVGYLYL